MGQWKNIRNICVHTWVIFVTSMGPWVQHRFKCKIACPTTSTASAPKLTIRQSSHIARSLSFASWLMWAISLGGASLCCCPAASAASLFVGPVSMGPEGEDSAGRTPANTWAKTKYGAIGCFGPLPLFAACVYGAGMRIQRRGHPCKHMGVSCLSI